MSRGRMKPSLLGVRGETGRISIEDIEENPKKGREGDKTSGLIGSTSSVVIEDKTSSGGEGGLTGSTSSIESEDMTKDGGDGDDGVIG